MPEHQQEPAICYYCLTRRRRFWRLEHHRPTIPRLLSSQLVVSEDLRSTAARSPASRPPADDY